jgi:hypothetical protein
MEILISFMITLVLTALFSFFDKTAEDVRFRFTLTFAMVAIFDYFKLLYI